MPKIDELLETHARKLVAIWGAERKRELLEMLETVVAVEAYTADLFQKLSPEDLTITLPDGSTIMLYSVDHQKRIEELAETLLLLVRKSA